MRYRLPRVVEPRQSRRGDTSASVPKTGRLGAVAKVAANRYQGAAKNQNVPVLWSNGQQETGIERICGKSRSLCRCGLEVEKMMISLHSAHILFRKTARTAHALTRSRNSFRSTTFPVVGDECPLLSIVSEVVHGCVVAAREQIRHCPCFPPAFVVLATNWLHLSSARGATCFSEHFQCASRLTQSSTGLDVMASRLIAVPKVVTSSWRRFAPVFIQAKAASDPLPSAGSSAKSLRYRFFLVLTIAVMWGSIPHRFCCQDSTDHDRGTGPPHPRIAYKHSMTSTSADHITQTMRSAVPYCR